MKFRTFPQKSASPAAGISSFAGNKFQKMATIHREQEKSGDFFPKKIHFGGQQKLRFREAEKAKEELKLKEKPKNLKKGGKNKKNKKPTKSDPVKGTSTEFSELANSDEDAEIPDVTDMLQNSEDEEENAEVPMINKKSEKSTKIVEFSSKKAEKSDSDDDFPEESEIPENPEESEGEEESEDDEAERLKFREEISKMPLGKVKEMKEKLGIKLFNKTYFGSSEVEKSKKIDKSIDKSAGGQHRPKEISSKRPVSTFRNIYGDHEKTARKKRWDPRFDSRAGDFKEVCFENNYQFLDEIRDSEMKDIRSEFSAARKEGDESKAARLKNTLQKMETREKTRAEKRRQAETRKELHDENIERMLRGEAPVFKTKAQVRRIDAEKKYGELKSENRLDKYLQRKAKKEAAKVKKARPY